MNGRYLVRCRVLLDLSVHDVSAPSPDGAVQRILDGLRVVAASPASIFPASPDGTSEEVRIDTESMSCDDAEAFGDEPFPTPGDEAERVRVTSYLDPLDPGPDTDVSPDGEYWE